MLAQNFKSAADLGITEPQFDALRKTLVLLETGKLEHVPAPPISKIVPKGGRFSFKFNMASWCREDSGCGTVCCLGGTAELIGGIDLYERPRALDDLFYAHGCDVPMDKLTPAQAATALRSYLTTGDAKWHEAVS